MGMITDLIKYNVKERFRKFRGQERNFDTKVLANIINGNEVQERVKHGDLHGYYGHWPRVKFGMNPQEGGFVDGKQVSLEPAIRVKYLRGFENGDIEHKIEFLDTESGRLAEKMHLSKAGGFSSAIDFKRIGNMQVPTGFFGFDFVFEPNYSGNRGYAMALDSVDGVVSEFDAVEDYNNMIQVMNRAFDEKDAELQALKKQLADTISALDSTGKTLEAVCIENTELYSMLEKAGKPTKEVALDGVKDLIRFSKTTKFDNAKDFMSADLAGFDNGEKAKKEEVVTSTFDSIADRYSN